MLLVLNRDGLIRRDKFHHSFSTERVWLGLLWHFQRKYRFGTVITRLVQLPVPLQDLDGFSIWRCLHQNFIRLLHLLSVEFLGRLSCWWFLLISVVLCTVTRCIGFLSELKVRGFVKFHRRLRFVNLVSLLTRKLCLIFSALHRESHDVRGSILSLRVRTLMPHNIFS